MTVIEFKRRERKDRSILDGWKTYWQTKIEILRKRVLKLVWFSHVPLNMENRVRERIWVATKEIDIILLTRKVWRFENDLARFCYQKSIILRDVYAKNGIFHFYYYRLLNNEKQCHKFPDCEFINVYIFRNFIFVFFISL